ncbi:MAG TPA: hypothetical protein VE861_05575 [Gemmatimonadaceae bacterium]|nr:hypothetical protein [Gemmatimonadaceae bacterium]
MVSRRGSGSGGCLLWLVLLGVGLVYGVPAARVYIRAYEYEDAMRQTLVHAKVDDDEAVRNRMRASADSIGNLPDAAYDVEILRQPGTIGLSAVYTDTIRFPLIPRPVTHRFSVERKE